MITILMLCVSWTAWAQPEAPAKRPDRPVVLKPADEAKVPEGAACPGTGCHTVRVKGAVPEGLHPFVVVAPLLAAPRMWVQPLITRVNSDGTFNGTAYCGTESNGKGEEFQIFIIAHRDRNRFKQGEVLTRLPEECEDESKGVCRVSDAVTVLRTR